MNKPLDSWSDFWKTLSLDQKKDITEKVGCSFYTLRNAANNGSKLSPDLAMKIESACGFSKAKIRPDIWG